jgi:hypothetical protein
LDRLRESGGCLLAESAWRTVRQEVSGSASRAGQLLISNASPYGPTASCPWVRVQEVLYPLCGCSSSPHSLSNTQHITNFYCLSNTQHITNFSHSLSLLPHGHHLHCPWNQGLNPSTAREAPLRAARTSSLGFPLFGTSFVQPRARTRYMQSSIDLSTRCIS